MKNRLLVFLLLIPCAIFAQIPNQGFEQWLGDSLNSWYISKQPDQSVMTITRSNDSHSGLYAVKGEVKQDTGNRIIIPGIISGSGGGFLISQRYLNLSAYYQFSSSGGDELDIAVFMFKDSSIIGISQINITASTSGYTKLDIPIEYTQEGIPTGCNIVIAAGSNSVQGGGHVGTWFLIDDLDFDDVTSVDDGKIIKNDFTLSQNYPNPFNPSTTIEFSLPQLENVSLKIYNSIGEEVATLIDGKTMETGSHKVQWNAENIANGVYVYRLKAGSYSVSKKMILLK